MPLSKVCLKEEINYENWLTYGDDKDFREIFVLGTVYIVIVNLHIWDEFEINESQVCV